MELLFVILGGAILGLIARYALPYRHTHGTVLIPALGAAYASLIWVALTWLGMPWDGGWIWFITLVSTAVVVAGVDLLVGILRNRADEALLSQYTKAGVAG